MLDSTESLLLLWQCCQLGGPTPATFGLKSGSDRRIVAASARRELLNPCGVESVGMSPLVPVATEGLQEHAVALRRPLRQWAGSGRSEFIDRLSIREIGYGKQ